MNSTLELRMWMRFRTTQVISFHRVCARDSLLFIFSRIGYNLKEFMYKRWWHIQDINFCISINWLRQMTPRFLSYHMLVCMLAHSSLSTPPLWNIPCHASTVIYDSFRQNKWIVCLWKKYTNENILQLTKRKLTGFIPAGKRFEINARLN